MRRLDSEKFAPLSLAKPFGMGRSKVWLYAITAIRFLALTGFRRGEVLGLRWAEVDIGRRTATLTETKTGKSVRPLSHTACDLLSKLPRKGDLIFPASRGGGQMTGFPKLWARIAKQAALPVDVTPHVLRHRALRRLRLTSATASPLSPRSWVTRDGRLRRVMCIPPTLCSCKLRTLCRTGSPS
jgi:integrase